MRKSYVAPFLLAFIGVCCGFLFYSFVGDGMNDSEIVKLNLGPSSPEDVSQATAGSIEAVRISLDETNMTLDEFLKVMGEKLQRNVIKMDRVSGQLELQVKDTPADKVLNQVLSRFNLGWQNDGNVIRVYSLSNPFYGLDPFPEKYTGTVMSVDLKNTSLENALRIFEELSQKKLKGTEHVFMGDKITLRLIDVPYDQYLDIILEMNDLSWRKVDQEFEILAGPS